jgi:hypothetical protein
VSVIASRPSVYRILARKGYAEVPPNPRKRTGLPRPPNQVTDNALSLVADVETLCWALVSGSPEEPLEYLRPLFEGLLQPALAHLGVGPVPEGLSGVGLGPGGPRADAPRGSGRNRGGASGAAGVSRGTEVRLATQALLLAMGVENAGLGLDPWLTLPDWETLASLVLLAAEGSGVAANAPQPEVRITLVPFCAKICFLGFAFCVAAESNLRIRVLAARPSDWHCWFVGQADLALAEIG